MDSAKQITKPITDTFRYLDPAKREKCINRLQLFLDVGDSQEKKASNAKKAGEFMACVLAPGASKVIADKKALKRQVQNDELGALAKVIAIHGKLDSGLGPSCREHAASSQPNSDISSPIHLRFKETVQGNLSVSLCAKDGKYLQNGPNTFELQKTSFVKLQAEMTKQHLFRTLCACGIDPKKAAKAAVRLDISGMNLPGIDLSGMDLRSLKAKGTNLAGANLSNTKLDAAVLIGANLTNANLNGANLPYAQMDKATMNNAILDHANLCGAIFIGADLTGANLNGVNKLSGLEVPKTDFSGANLTGATCKGANLNGAIMIGSNLTDAKIIGTNLNGANLTGTKLHNTGFHLSDLTDAILKNADMKYTNMSSTKLERADLSDATLVNVTLNNAKMQSAILIRLVITGPVSDLSHVDLSNADLSYMSVEKAIWTGIILTGANTTGANLPGVMLNTAGGMSSDESVGEHNDVVIVSGYANDGFPQGAPVDPIESTYFAPTGANVDATVISGYFNEPVESVYFKNGFYG